MTEAILSLVGVLIGGIITLFSTWFIERMKQKEDKRKKSLEVLAVTIHHYNKLWEKARNKPFWKANLDDIIKYYYSEFSEMRLNNRVNELLFLSKDERDYIKKIDMNIEHWINEAENCNLLSLTRLSKELNEDIEKLSVLFNET